MVILVSESYLFAERERKQRKREEKRNKIYVEHIFSFLVTVVWHFSVVFVARWNTRNIKCAGISNRMIRTNRWEIRVSVLYGMYGVYVCCMRCTWWSLCLYLMLMVVVCALVQNDIQYENVCMSQRAVRVSASWTIQKAHRNIMNQEKRVYFIEKQRKKTHTQHFIQFFFYCVCRISSERKKNTYREWKGEVGILLSLMWNMLHGIVVAIGTVIEIN